MKKSASTTKLAEECEATVTSPTRGNLPEIRLRERRVHWVEGTVDNENLGRKKSNVCCIFHAQNPKLDPNSPCFDPEDPSEPSPEDGDTNK